MIDWRSTQASLARAGFPCGRIDGVRGMKTLRALLDFGAGYPMGGAGDERAAVGLLWYDAYGMTTPARLAEFLAQTLHETGGFATTVEKLSYDATRLAATWPQRFAVDPHAARKLPNALALRLQHKPVELANEVYARPAEGNTQPGDGWRYRGRGDLQLTFRNNYASMGAALGIDLVGNPDKAAEPGIGHRIALEFWKRAGVNACCDRGDFYGARGLTNCGTAHPKVPPIGLEDVRHRRERLLAILS